MTEKDELRKKYKLLRSQLPEAEKRAADQKLTEAICAMKEFRAADHVLLFASFGSEASTDEIFHRAVSMGKKIYYPRVTGEDLVFYRIESEHQLLKGYFGIREPDLSHYELSRYLPEKEEGAFVLVPGLAFDRRKYRIGYGRGFYDRFLQEFNGFSCGFCYTVQICEQNLQLSDTDLPVMAVTTERGIL